MKTIERLVIFFMTLCVLCILCANLITNYAVACVFTYASGISLVLSLGLAFVVHDVVTRKHDRDLAKPWVNYKGANGYRNRK